ncbi:MAG: PaaI family thioesterase [Leptospiraceae bacterium]|nr:PaaI family thioesterase [Leptospiraceae bacterium]
MDVKAKLELLIDAVDTDIFTLLDDDDFLRQSQNLIEQAHPGATGMRLTAVDGQKAEALIPYGQENRALHGLLHGGAYFTVGDTMTALMAAFHLEKKGQRMVTMNASIRYLRPVKTDTVVAQARLKSKAGNELKFICDFLTAEGKKAAQARYKYLLVQI